jgi:hypothetical protein
MNGRMTHRILWSLWISLALVACGRGGEPDTAASAGDENEATDGDHEEPIGESHHGEGGGMPAEVRALHDELAPIYHQEPGAARAAATCEHAEAFRGHAATIASVSPPEAGDPEMWTAAVAGLTSSAEALGTECAAGGTGAEAALEDFHTAFHAVMEAGGGGHHDEHEHHDEHGHHGEHEHH